MNNIVPTVFHVTHWKAGSQWVAEVLKQSAPERFLPWKISDPLGMGGIGTPSIYLTPLRTGKVYGTVYLTSNELQKIVDGPFLQAGEFTFFYPHRILSNWWNFTVRQKPCRFFMVTRDLRDTLISFYFSTKHSHEMTPNIMAVRRQALLNLSDDDGLIYMIDEVLPYTANIQASWIGVKDVLMLRYEDIIGNEFVFFEQLIDYCQINISRDRLHDIIRYNIFEAATGRKRGELDVNAHLRKGIAGDWRNYFSERVKAEFKEKYGQLLIDTGYEKDLSW